MTKPIIAGLLLVALALLIGILEKESAITVDSISKDPPVFQRPLACDAIVSQRGAGERWVSLCYIRRGN